MTNEGLTGGCLCGAVRYATHSSPKGGGHCQCRDCQKNTGTGHSTHIAFPAEAVKVQGALIAYAKASDRGNTVTRAFCPTCGSPILVTVSVMPDLVFVAAGSLDNPDLVQPSMVMFTASAAAWDVVDPSLRRFESDPG